jgi:hypothetical protein
MAAGLGFKTFTTGEVLTAADTNGYLMQGVLVFASAAARDAAITSPQEGQFAYLKDTNVTTYYTGSAWTNLDTTGMTNPMTTTGDTIYSSSGSTPARLGIGSTGQVLTVASGIPSWATPAGTSGPAFSAISAAEQLISANTNTKVTFGTETFDTAGNFASSRFTPTTAGYYQINASLTLSSNSAGEFYGYFYKNGDRINRFSNSASALTNMTVSGGMVVAMNGSSDYLECYVAISNTGNPRIDSGSNQTQFSGVWIRGL